MSFTILMIAMPIILTGVMIARAIGRHQLAESVKRESKAMVDAWAQYNYLPIADSSFPDRVKRLVVRASEGSQLGREEKAQLILELLLFFRAYNYGTYEAHKAFRMPSDISFSWKRNRGGSLDELLTGWFQLPTAITNKSADDKFKAYLVASDGSGTVFSNYFTGVCFEQSRIVVKRSRNPISAPWATAFWPTNFRSVASVDAPFPNTGYFSQKENHSVIRFKDSLEDLANRLDSVTIADCFFFIKDSKAAHWLPDDIVTCNESAEGDYTLPAF